MPQDFINVSIPVSREIAEFYARKGEPMPLWAVPSAVLRALGEGEPDPRDRFSELDRLIASVVDEHGPVQAGEIARLLEDDCDHITTDAGVRDRFRTGRPLVLAGYRRTKIGYVGGDDASAS